MIDHVKCGLWQKTRKENDMTDHTDSIYVQNKIELS